MKTFQSVDEYILSKTDWQEELILLRKTLKALPLEETIKWGSPVYTFDGKNIVGLAAFKEYACLWFFQGVLLKDTQKKLMNAQEGKTKALRQWRFAAYDQIHNDLKQIKAYVTEAIANEKKGNKISPDRNKPIVIPVQLKQTFKSDTAFKDLFKKLSKSDQREYTDYIHEAKKIETKEKRVEKIVPMIMGGKGLYDKYKK